MRLEPASLENAAYAIIATTTAGVVTHFNRAAERMLGYSAEEVVGRISPETIHLREEIEARALEFGLELGEVVEPSFDVFTVKTQRGLPNEHLWTYVRKDGGRLPVLLSVTALRDDAGQIDGYLGIAADFTERMAAEKALRSSEEKLRNLFLMSPLGIALTDMEGRYVEFNESFRRICGYSDAELRALNYWDLTPPKYKAEEDRQLETLALTGRYGPYEKEYVHKDGHLVPLRLNGTVITGSDGRRYIWSIVEDISERKRAEAVLLGAMAKAEAASLAKTNFLANVSHELRTPLNGVIALAGALARTDLTGRQREMVDIIVNSGVSLERILSEILDLSKVEAGRIQFEAAPMDLVAEVLLAADLMGGKAEDKGVAFTTRVSPGAEGIFVGDAVRIRQVVSNLVSNAVKFTERGSIEVGLSVADPKRPDAPSVVTITVTDTGLGIDPVMLPKLFERFTQADESITRRYGGTGLGLSICKGLAELMGGEISAVSEPGQGSQFTFRVPLMRGQAPARSAEPGAAPAERQTPLRILVAEDHPVNRRVLELLLEPLEASLVVTENGDEALKAYQAGRFDVVLMDMQMPVMDGLTAVREMRAWETAAGSARTPIVMLTANTLSAHREQAAAAGADAFLAKPVAPEALYACLEEAVAAA